MSKRRGEDKTPSLNWRLLFCYSVHLFNGLVSRAASLKSVTSAIFLLISDNDIGDAIYDTNDTLLLL